MARSSASRSGFSQPSGMTAVPSSMRLVRWVAAASTAIGEEMPYCRCRCRTQALSNPESLTELDDLQRRFVAGRGSAPSNRPMVRKPSLVSGCGGTGMDVSFVHAAFCRSARPAGTPGLQPRLCR